MSEFDSLKTSSFCLRVVGFILCHAALNSDATALSLWKLALQSSSCLCLFRDEVFHIHKAAEDLFVNLRGSASSLTQRFPICVWGGIYKIMSGRDWFCFCSVFLFSPTCLSVAATTSVSTTSVNAKSQRCHMRMCISVPKHQKIEISTSIYSQKRPHCHSHSELYCFCSVQRLDAQGTA